MRQKLEQTKAKRRISRTIRDVVVPTSLGIGLALAACSGTPATPADGAADKKSDAQTDWQIYPVMPPVDSGAKDTASPDVQIYPIMMPLDSAAKDTAKADVQGSETVYAIMPKP